MLSLNELLLKKSFSDLVFEEKQFVLSQITKEEYDAIRLLLINSKESFKRDFEELRVNDITRKKLSIAFKLKHKKEKVNSIHINIWKDYKNVIRPTLSIGIIAVLAMLAINNIQKRYDDLLSIDINNVTSFLNKKNTPLKINEKYSSDLIDSNKYNKDSIIEMNNYLRINTEGLSVN